MPSTIESGNRRTCEPQALDSSKKIGFRKTTPKTTTNNQHSLYQQLTSFNKTTRKFNQCIAFDLYTLIWSFTQEHHASGCNLLASQLKLNRAYIWDSFNARHEEQILMRRTAVQCKFYLHSCLMLMEMKSFKATSKFGLFRMSMIENLELPLV